MPRPRSVLVIFGLCLTIVLGTMTWLSVTVLRLESNERRMRRDAALEDNVRLALWRMDSSLAPLLARENGRPSWEYDPTDPFHEMAGRNFGHAIVAPSPLNNPSPEVLLYFQIDAAGGLSSPQVSREGASHDVPESQPRRGSDAERRLAELNRVLDRDRLAAALPPAGSPDALVLAPPQTDGNAPVMRTKAQQGLVEQRYRARNVMQLAEQQQSLANSAYSMPGVPTLLTPVWIADRLILVRRVMSLPERPLQGCWLDWPAIRENLLTDTRDLLPDAQLLPARQAEPPDPARTLAALPVRLVPGELPAGMVTDGSPLAATLAVAWAAALLAIVAVAALLAGTIALSERRAAFVSAVTHELRTPLTTFRLYTELLDEGTVSDESKRRGYVSTLRREADRLCHLVENVLSFARLERGRQVAVDRVTVGELVERSRDRLETRTAAAKMQLDIEIEPEVARSVVRADVPAVERILFNLVENACKYAASAADRTITLSADATQREVLLRVCDRGPGIRPEHAHLLFRPFHKSGRRTDDVHAGVGLGLALSRRLARGMGGELRIESSSDRGACFALALPRAG